MAAGVAVILVAGGSPSRWGCVRATSRRATTCWARPSRTRSVPTPTRRARGAERRARDRLGDRGAGRRPLLPGRKRRAGSAGGVGLRGLALRRHGSPLRGDVPPDPARPSSAFRSIGRGSTACSSRSSERASYRKSPGTRSGRRPPSRTRRGAPASPGGRVTSGPRRTGSRRTPPAGTARRRLVPQPEPDHPRVEEEQRVPGAESEGLLRNGRGLPVVAVRVERPREGIRDVDARRRAHSARAARSAARAEPAPGDRPRTARSRDRCRRRSRGRAAPPPGPDRTERRRPRHRPRP